MTEKLATFFEGEAGKILGNSLSRGHKLFRLTTLTIQINQAQIAGILDSKKGLTKAEAEKLRSKILEDSKSL